MSYFMIVKIECVRQNQFPEALECVGQDMINGLTHCYATTPTKITYNYSMYEGDENESANIEELVKDKKEL